MNSGETVRFECGECLEVFDLCYIGPVEIDEDSIGPVNPRCCPFCMSNEIKPLNDVPASVQAAN